jgi:hypothetical protein
MFQRCARPPEARRGTRRLSSIVSSLMAFGGGCSDDVKEPDGFYVYCDGKADGLYYVNGLTQEIIKEFSLCLGPEFVNESGETGYGEVNLGKWTNDTEDIDFLRTLCVETGQKLSQTGCARSAHEDNGSMASPMLSSKGQARPFAVGDNGDSGQRNTRVAEQWLANRDLL